MPVRRKHSVTHGISARGKLRHRCPKMGMVGEVQFGVVVVHTLSRWVNDRQGQKVLAYGVVKYQ